MDYVAALAASTPPSPVKGFNVWPLLFAFSEIHYERHCRRSAATAKLVRQHGTSTAAANLHMHCPYRVHLAPHLDSTICIKT